MSYQSLIGEKLHEDNANATGLPDQLLCLTHQSNAVSHDVSFLVAQFTFHRNDSIFMLIFAIIGLFFLLGAAFLLPPEQLSNRMAVTFGVAAIIFALSTIMQNNKPLYSVHILTFSDALIYLLAVGTIAFTVSSVLSGTKTIMDVWPTEWAWIDLIFFILVSYFAVGLIAHSSTYFTTLFFFIALFGLGYGIIWNSVVVRWLRYRKYRREKSPKF